MLYTQYILCTHFSTWCRVLFTLLFDTYDLMVVILPPEKQNTSQLNEDCQLKLKMFNIFKKNVTPFRFNKFTKVRQCK